tara:strand:+ start:2065 stop:2634 length:570 start_codon:yes stop_codon:yes gene_type:complete
MIRLIAALFTLAILGACAAGHGPGGPPRGTEAEIAALAQSLRALDPQVDPAEATRAARISYEYSHQLALAYQITDAPLTHNAKVNRGEKPRGLCRHWAEDMERRLNQEGFRTLVVHRAIANANKRFLIEHSSAVISARGDTMEQGIVVDPWRMGGVLFWSPVRSDPKYPWRPREDVQREKGLVRYAVAG